MSPQSTSNDLDLTLDWAKIKYKYANRKLMRDFLYDGNSNVSIICHHLRDVCNQNMHDHGLRRLE